MPEVIDIKDKKILFEMSLNARAPVSEIAKRVGLSKQVVKYRIENLLKNGILEGFYAILNINALGFLYHRVFIKFQNVSLEVEKEIIDFCSNHKDIGWVAQLFGAWDLAFVVWAKNTLQFQEVYEEFVKQFGEFIEEKSLSISTCIYHLKDKYLLNQQNEDVLVLGGKDIVVINDTDHALLGLLSKNARLSLVELGQKLKMHPQVVRQHIKRLQKENVILGYTLKVNHNKLGFTHHKVFINLKKLTEENINALITHIKTLPQSIYITKALGQSDLEFEIMVKSETEFNEILRALRLKYTNIIKNLDSFVVFSQPYINYLPEMK